MKKFCMLCIIVALVCPNVFSATKTIVRKTKGRGITRDEAINKALSQAVAQARGVKIGSGDYEFGYRSASADIEKKDTGKEVEFDTVSVQTDGSVLKTEIEGLVKTYEVLEEKKIDDTTYEITLKVWVYDYEDPDQTRRLRLAIMPIKLSQRYQAGKFIEPGSDISHMLSQKLYVGLSETNKFAVLDREYILDFAHNRNILLSDDSSLEEKAKLGKVLGADYMIVGTISDIRFEIKQKTSSAIGHPIREYEADFVFDYRLIVGPTRRVRLADTVNLSLETEEVKKLVKKWEPEDLDFRELFDSLASKVANQVVETIIDRLYAIRIASIDESGQIIVNQGGKRILQGLVLDVFTEEKEIFDIDTKESLGKKEAFIATIKIDKVMPKF
ncbi:MAG: CsgG/HfaB family protein, partial [Planctomycetota bacterium]